MRQKGLEDPQINSHHTLYMRSRKEKYQWTITHAGQDYCGCIRMLTMTNVSMLYVNNSRSTGAGLRLGKHISPQPVINPFVAEIATFQQKALK